MARSKQAARESTGGLAPRKQKAFVARATAAPHKACKLPAPVPKAERNRIKRDITDSRRAKYFHVSCKPITPEAEQRMEQISKVVTGEDLTNVGLQPGHSLCKFECARCNKVLYSSKDKFAGPCLWPSFRAPASPDALATIDVPHGEYNGYECDVKEIYCGCCDLFLGHQFRDGKKTGDKHRDAEWRHCVLSLSLRKRGAPVMRPWRSGKQAGRAWALERRRDRSGRFISEPVGVWY